MKLRLWIIMGIMLLSVHLFAEAKKTIQVRFTITEPQYKKYFNPDTGTIENRCSAAMVNILEKTFGFFHFTTMGNDHVLNIELIDKEGNFNSNSGLKEVGFNVYIKQQENQGSVAPVYWVFRSVEQSDLALPDNIEVFVNEVIQAFIKGVSKNKEALVRNILSKVEVANDFYFVKDLNRFIVPLTNKENNIANTSQFLLMALVPDELIGIMPSNVTTTVIGPLVNRESIIQKYNLPMTYPEGSLVVVKENVNSEETPIDLSNANVVEKKIFILKHSAFFDSDIKISPPNSNPE